MGDTSKPDELRRRNCRQHHPVSTRSIWHLASVPGMKNSPREPQAKKGCRASAAARESVNCGGFTLSRSTNAVSQILLLPFPD